jgi:pimeloyl-ACP methyl ester carboxylesterase
MIFIPILLGIAALVLLAAFITYRLTFYNKHKDDFDPYHSINKTPAPPFAEVSRDLISTLERREFEPVSINSRSGGILHGKYYHVRDGAPLDIMFHGYKSGAIHDFAGGAKESLSLGHNLLLVDQRGHGMSHGRTITFGVKERFDALDWSEYAVSRFGGGISITLVGISMGAATVICASELPLPAEVRGIIADCPCSSGELIIKKIASEMGFPPKLVFPFIRLGGIVFGGFDVCERTPLDAAEHARVPMLLIHGDGDSFVPCQMSRDIAERYSAELTFEVFPEAGHGTSYLYDTERYRKALSDFYSKILKEDSSK